MDCDLLDALNEVIDNAGGRRAVEKRMGRSKAYLRRIFKRGAIRYQTIRDILKAAGVGPGDFFHKLHPPESAQTPVVKGLAIGEDPDPDLTGLLRLIGAQAEAAHLVSGTQSTPASEATTLKAFETAAAKLDEQRYSNPGAAAEDARRILFGRVQELQVHPVCKAAIAAKLAGVLGSCHRTAAKLREAGWALTEALRIDCGDAIKADLFQRVGVLMMARGEYPTAIEFASQASVIYLRLRNYACVGRCCVDEGLYLAHDGATDEAFAIFEMALRMLPRNELRHRASAWSAMGRLRFEAGDLECAKHYLTEAESCGVLDPYSQGILAKIRGELATAAGDIETAARRFLEARDLLLRINPVDAALAGIDASASSLDLGRIAEGIEIARDLGQLIEPLKSVSPVAEEALWKLLLTVHRGEAISRRVLERFRREISLAATHRA